MKAGNVFENGVNAYYKAETTGSEYLWKNTDIPVKKESFNNILEGKVSNKSNETRNTSLLDNYAQLEKGIKSSKVPYAELADDNGIINYNGIMFVCDEKENAICLGDMTHKEKVLTIPLSGGGCLKVNRDSLDSLTKAIGMFSPEDVKRILVAIATDAKARGKQKEIEDEVTKELNRISENKSL